MRSNMTPIHQRHHSDFGSTQASTLIKQMTSYMPALSPVLVRPSKQNLSRLTSNFTPMPNAATADSDVEDPTQTEPPHSAPAQEQVTDIGGALTDRNKPVAANKDL